MQTQPQRSGWRLMPDRARQRETAAHRRARTQRSEDRILLRLAASAHRIACYHGSSVPWWLVQCKPLVVHVFSQTDGVHSIACGSQTRATNLSDLSAQSRGRGMASMDTLRPDSVCELQSKPGMMPTFGVSTYGSVSTVTVDLRPDSGTASTTGVPMVSTMNLQRSPLPTISAVRRRISSKRPASQNSAHTEPPGPDAAGTKLGTPGTSSTTALMVACDIRTGIISPEPGTFVKAMWYNHLVLIALGQTSSATSMLATSRSWATRRRGLRFRLIFLVNLFL